MDEIVFSETRPGVMEPTRQARLKRITRILAEDFPTERVLELAMGIALWGMAAWGIHEFLERLSASMSAA